jgi:V/A-type H+-transporting ATPase subunit A
MRKGVVERVSGPLVVCGGVPGVTLGEIVEVGGDRLIGEVVRVVGEKFFVQVYETTSGLKPGEEVIATGKRLVAELGPGLLGSIFDGIQRPLPELMQEWPVRAARPWTERLPLEEPLLTGQRVIDTFFPIAKGGAVCVPGGFGTGKTVLLHKISMWSDADVVVYVGCGERGNEMAELLKEFPQLVDPKRGRPIIERSVLIANTSNMPVMAREASVYMGVTIAEYFRDMGYNVAVLVDSTSRWAEAIREISGRLEEMPVEQGFPAYLADRLAEVYERAGRVVCLGRPERAGSVTVIAAISPPGGDYNEPVTIHTLRFVGAMWALDTDLAYRRHFPAINWLRSFSQYAELLEKWWKREVADDAPRYRRRALALLTAASEIEAIASVVGESALPDDQLIYSRRVS